MREIVYGLGVLLVIVGLIIALGNMTGMFVTMSYMGFMVMAGGAALTWLARLLPSSRQ